jgi:hypothetical protein
MESSRLKGAGIVSEKPVSLPGRKKTPLYERIRQILESARSSVVRSVNTTQVGANWLIGREIVEEEQMGRKRAGYGDQLLEDLSAKLTRDFGTGYSEQNLRFIRQFYLMYPLLLGDPKIRYAVRSESVAHMESTQRRISNAVRGKSEAAEKIHAVRGKSNALDFSDAAPRKLPILDVPHVLEIGHALRSQSVPIKDSAGNEIGHTLRGRSSSILVSIGALQEAILKEWDSLKLK